jgi:serine/threonine protein kinase
VFNPSQLGTDKICLECNREFTGIISNCPHDNAVLFPRVQDPFVGTTLAGNYEILSVIGHGGMGVVYKARHALMDRLVAIKMLHPQLVSDSMSVKRFQLEGKAATRMKHEHVIAVYDFNISSTGQPYIVMDYLEGEALSDVIKREGNVAVERAIRILMQACDALEHAHREGVLHRDLKPTNIVLTNSNGTPDFVKVVDFGVAKLMNTGQESQRLTQAGEVCGSPVYMSPEQCIGADMDRRSDVYSMGVVIYETLTGRLPILGKTMVDTMSRHISDAPLRFSESRPDLYIPERLEAVIFKALAKMPEDRHQSMAQLMQDLDIAIPRAGRSEVLRSVPSAESYSTGKAGPEKAKLPLIAIVAATVAVLGLVGAGIFFIGAMKPRAAPTPAAISLPATAPTAPTNPMQPSVPPNNGAVTSAAPATPSTAAGTHPVAITPTAKTAEAQADTVPKSSSHASISSAALKPPVVAAARPQKPRKPPQAAHHVERPRATAAVPVKRFDPFSELRGERSWAR